MSRTLDCDPSFVAAVMALEQKGDGKPLVAMLFAGHPQTVDEWLLLAAYHRGDLHRRPGPRANETIARAAALYPMIKRDLPDAAVASGKRMRSGQLRKAAIACALAYLGQGPEGAEQKLENLLRRSRRPRKPRRK